MAEEKLKIIIVGDSKSAQQAINEVGKSFKTAEDKLKSSAQAMTSIGAKLSIAITAPLVLIGKKSLEMAMNVVESENLFEVSMGNMSKAAREWSIAFADSVGLNEYNVRKQVGTFNVMLNSMGLTENAAYNMAKGMTTLAYDMASFYNLDVEDAFMKLQSGITGEIEPLKRLGIVVNETTVATYAYTHGIAQQGDQLTEQQKIMARYGAIMETTSKAQGDLARTIESPANQLRIFKEQVNLAMISLGQGLIPIMQQAITIIKPYIEKFANASDETKNFTVKLMLVAAAAGPVLLFLGSAINAVRSLNTAFATLNATMAGSLLLRFGGLAAAFILAITQVGSSVSKTHKDLDGIIDPIEKMNVSIENLENTLVRFGGRYTDSIMKSIDALQELAKTYPDVATEMTNLILEYEKGSIKTKEFADKTAELAKQYEDISKSPMQGYYEQMHKNTYATDELKDSTDELKGSTDDLVSSLNNLYNLNQSVTEATWNYEDSLKNLIDVMAKANSTERDKQTAIFATQDALENLQIAMAKELADTDTTIERKKELQNQYIQTGLQAVSSGAMSEEAFMKMAVTFGLKSADIIAFADAMGIKLDAVTRARIVTVSVDYSQAVQAVRDLQSLLAGVRDKTVTIETIYKTSRMLSGNMASGGEIKASGGIIAGSGLMARDTRWISDLSIPVVKGEAILPAYIVRAIKENRGSFAGIDVNNSRNTKKTEIHIHLEYSEQLASQTFARLFAQKVGMLT